MCSNLPSSSMLCKLLEEDHKRYVETRLEAKVHAMGIVAKGSSWLGGFEGGVCLN